MIKTPMYVYIVKALPCDADGANDQVVKVFADEKKAETFKRKMQTEDERDRKKLLCDPTEFYVEKWEVE